MRRLWRSKIFRGILLVLVVLVGGFAWMMSQMPKMGGPKRIEAAPGVVGIDTSGAYAWLIRTPHGAALVDAGMDQSGKAILAELERQGLGPNDVHTILVTHGHYDHTGALALFPKAAVWIGPGDAAYASGEHRPKAPMPALFSRFARKPALPAAPLNDVSGHSHLDVDGAEVRVVPVPGHTPGSTMYLYRDILFSGDSLFGSRDGVMYPPSFICDDIDENHASVHKLAALPFTLLADGHSGVTPDAHARLAKLLQ